MIPWETLGSAWAPDGGRLVLVRRGDEYTIRVDGRELMSSRLYGSEAALAHLACAAIGAPRAPDGPPPRVLVGGLGMGFTLRATLDSLPPEATVVVAEIVSAVVDWNRGPLADLAGRPLEDARVTVEVADVGALLRASTVRFDAILLDVDNGPAALTRPANQALYADTGLAMMKRALRRGGVLAVWSSVPEPRFERRLLRAGFDAMGHSIPARPGGRGGLRHVVYVCKVK